MASSQRRHSPVASPWDEPQCSFTVQHATQRKVLKGEDILFVDDENDLKVFCICDGHMGVAAAKHVKANLMAELSRWLPSLPTKLDSQEGQKWASALPAAITRTFRALDKKYASRNQLAGCTCTLVLFYQGLLTVANVGDSSAVMDTGVEVVRLTVDHRVHDNKPERQRVIQAGNNVAPVSISGNGPASAEAAGIGPLRIWPGGLCVSRAIGDIDVGSVVIPHPHIRQIMVPSAGARVMIASDGVWDRLPHKRVVKLGRTSDTATAADTIITHCLRTGQGFLCDDTSLIVVDFLPSGKQSFVDVVASKGRQPRPQPAVSSKAESAGGFMSCFCGGPPAVAGDDPPAVTHVDTGVTFLVDMDTFYDQNWKNPAPTTVPAVSQLPQGAEEPGNGLPEMPSIPEGQIQVDRRTVPMSFTEQKDDVNAIEVEARDLQKFPSAAGADGIFAERLTGRMAGLDGTLGMVKSASAKGALQRPELENGSLEHFGSSRARNRDFCDDSAECTIDRDEVEAILKHAPEPFRVGSEHPTNKGQAGAKAADDLRQERDDTAHQGDGAACALTRHAV